MENRNGLIVEAMLTQADGTAERDAALLMLHRRWRKTRRAMSVGADKAYRRGAEMKLRGLCKVGWQFLMTVAAFNQWRIPKLARAEV